MPRRLGPGAYFGSYAVSHVRPFQIMLLSAVAKIVRLLIRTCSTICGRSASPNIILDISGSLHNRSNAGFGGFRPPVAKLRPSNLGRVDCAFSLSVGWLIVPPSAVYAVKCKRVRVTDDPRLGPSTIQRVARPTGASLVNLMANAELGVARAYTSCHML